MNHILLVEDDIIDQKSFSREMGQLSYSYHIVSSIAEAESYLAENTCDVIIADYFLGDGTAFELLEAFPALPVIIITGAGDEDIAVQAIKRGAYDYLVKDLDHSYLKRLQVSIENALVRHQLAAAEREQRAFADALRDVAMVLNSTLELEEVLNRILQNLRRVIPHDASNIMLIKDDSAEIVHSWNCFEPGSSDPPAPLVIANEAHLNHMLLTFQPVVIPAVKMNNACILTGDQTGTMQSYVGAPISMGESVIGFLNLSSFTPDFFTARHAERLQAFADQAAVALKNARLYQQGRELAALQERQRLARDLHDSVTQTLFSAHAFAEATAKLWENNPASIGEELNQLRRLTRGALAEMRTLLLELRPQTLLDADLSELLKQLLDNLAGRTSIQVDLRIPKTFLLPPEVQTAFYRIAQEALNNVEKHSQAGRVTIDLLNLKQQVVMQIEDDGRGFNKDQALPPRTGFAVMRERAEEAALELAIDSQPGKGTRVTATWQRPPSPQTP